MSQSNSNEESKIQEINNNIIRMVDPEELEKIIGEMTSNQQRLKIGYNILNEYENLRNFHVGVLINIFNNLNNDKFKKLACAAFNMYIRRNWNINYFISNEEKLVIILSYEKYFIQQNTIIFKQYCFN